MTTAPAVGIDPLFQIGFQGYGTRGEKNTLNRQFFKERLEVFNAYRLAFLNRSALKLFSITLPIVLIFAENDNPFARKAPFSHLRRGGPDGPIPHKYTGVSWRRSPGYVVLASLSSGASSISLGVPAPLECTECRNAWQAPTAFSSQLRIGGEPAPII